MNKLTKAPMGVSQWRLHGKKWGYWKFFRQETIEEIEIAVDGLIGYIGSDVERLAARNRWKTLKPKK